MNKQVLKAEKRKLFGRKIKSLRKEGILPANIYGKKVKSLAIQFPLNEFEKIYKEVGETGIIEVAVDKAKRPALIHNVQLDPVTDFPLHVDLLQVDLKEKVTTNVPVELIGESPAEKHGLGTVVQHLDEIEVEALPTDLPERFEVDTSKLEEVDNAIVVKDLEVDTKKIEIKSDPEQIIVKVEPLREEEEELPPAPSEEEVVSEEGEAPVEGEGVPAEKPEGEAEEKSKETEEKKE